jgi:hypothetical protein
VDLQFLKALSHSERWLPALTTLSRGFGRELGWHELTAYDFLADSARAVFWSVLRPLGWSQIQAMHLFHTLLSAAAVFVFCSLAFLISGNRRFAVMCTLALMLLPKFIGHSQNNPKDLPALFFFVLTIYGVVSLTLRGGWWRATGAGIALGLALNHGVICFDLLIVLPLAVILIWRPFARRRLKEYALVLAVSAVTFYAFWPWIWLNPLANLARAARLIGTFPREGSLLYLGRMHEWTNTPWHYSLVCLAVSTPLPHLLAMSLSTLAAFPRFATSESVRAGARLGALWCTTLVTVDLFASSHYDGVRHLLAILPGMALLAGAGLEVAWQGLARTRGKPWAGAAFLGAWLAFTLWSITPMRPYEDAYLNEIANAMIDGPSEDVFEVEYWGCSYPEGLRWLAEHAEPDARVVLPLGDYLMHLDAEGQMGVLKGRRISLEPRDFFDRSAPSYAIFITRKARYDQDVRRIEATRTPVFTVKRQKATLLEIYKNDGGG